MWPTTELLASKAPPSGDLTFWNDVVSWWVVNKSESRSMIFEQIVEFWLVNIKANANEFKQLSCSSKINFKLTSDNFPELNRAHATKWCKVWSIEIRPLGSFLDKCLERSFVFAIFIPLSDFEALLNTESRTVRSFEQLRRGGAVSELNPSIGQQRPRSPVLYMNSD